MATNDSVYTYFVLDWISVCYTPQNNSINRRKFCEPYINTLILKWVPYDLLSPFRITSEINVMRTKVNKDANTLVCPLLGILWLLSLTLLNPYE